MKVVREPTVHVCIYNMTDERNFRSYYYEKFGFRGAEEKKSVELLLKERILDTEKLRLYCLRFPVSARYRLYLWKVILGVLPADQDSHEFVMNNRREQYNIVRHALQVTRAITEETLQPVILLKMFLLEEGLLPFKQENILRPATNQAFVYLGQAVSSMAEDCVDAYWVTKRFYKFFNAHYSGCLPALTSKVQVLLKKEDGDQKLLHHFDKHEIWSSLPLLDWFSCCYAGYLPDSSFERVGDIVLGGSIMILAYVAVGIFMTLRRPLLIMSSKDDMMKYLTQIPEDSGDIIVSKAIDMWEKHGHHLAKCDSPGPIHRSPT